MLGTARRSMATILLVDDEKVARTVYGDYLAEAGHTVTCVGSVAEAARARWRCIASTWW